MNRNEDMAATFAQLSEDKQRYLLNIAKMMNETGRDDMSKGKGEEKEKEKRESREGDNYPYTVNI